MARSASISAAAPAFLSVYTVPSTSIENTSALYFARIFVSSSCACCKRFSCCRIFIGSSFSTLSCKAYRFFLYCPSSTSRRVNSVSSSIFRLIFGFAAVIALISAYESVVSSISSASRTVRLPFSIWEIKRCLFSKI